MADDEAAMRLLFRVNLPLTGYEVVEAGDGVEALEVARREQVDLVLLDVMMPRLSGLEVAAQLLADPQTSSVPIVFISARADGRDIRQGLELGAVDYVTKPFDPVRLGAHLDAVLAAVASGDGERLRQERLRALAEAS